MTSVPEAFEICRQRLEITATEQNEAARRQKEVREHIREAFEVDRDFLTGSYARHTKTKPLKDVDIFFVLGKAEARRRADQPRKILDAFQKCLEKHYDAEQLVRGRRSIEICFAKPGSAPSNGENVLSVDVVPAFALGDHYEIPDDVTGKWIETNPETHKAKATAKNKLLDQKWIPLVKMLKGWNVTAGKPIKPSFLVEVMALDLVEGPVHSYPDAIRRFLASAADRIHEQWPDPAGLGPPVSDQMTKALCDAAEIACREAEKRATRAFRAEAQGRTGEAIALWHELLGPYFPTR
jgi:hypothetical protein